VERNLHSSEAGTLVGTTLGIYTHAMRRRHDDSADKMAELAGLTNLGNKVETIGSMDGEESELSDCSDGSRVGIESGGNYLICLRLFDCTSRRYP
jgi:hypothetical protein